MRGGWGDKTPNYKLKTTNKLEIINFKRELDTASLTSLPSRGERKIVGAGFRVKFNPYRDTGHGMTPGK
jgi:hypothetical protein